MYKADAKSQGPPGLELFGRATELRTIDALIATPCEPRVLSVVGEAGIGKSSLLAYGAHAAQAQGGVVYWGRCWEAAQNEAFWPWMQVISELGGKAPQPAADASRVKHLYEWLGALRACLQRLSSGDTAPNSGGKRIPWCLIFDDLQWADESSLLLLELFIQQQLGGVVLLSWRAPEVTSEPAQWERLEALRARGLSLMPSPLDCPAVHAFLTSQGLDTSGVDLERVCRDTGGNPFFVRELSTHLKSGAVTGVSEGVRAYVVRRVAQLSAEERKVLRVAAALGRVFPQGLLADAAGVSPSTLVAHLQKLERSGFVVSESTAGQWAFVHDLLREAIYSAQPAEERATDHLNIARRLQGGATPDARSVYEHLLCTDESVESLLIWAERAAEMHLHQLAYESALGVLERFMARLSEGHQLDGDELRRITHLHVHAAKAAMCALERSTALSYCRRGLEWARRAKDALAMAELALVYGQHSPFSSVDREHVQLLEEALAGLPPTELGWRLRLQARLAAALQPAMDPEKPFQMARQSIQAARQTGDDRVLGSVLALSRGAFRPVDPLPLRLEHDLECLSWAERHGERHAELDVLFRLVGEGLEMGERAKAEGWLGRAEGIAAQLGLSPASARAHRIRASLAALDGDAAAVRQSLEAASQERENPVGGVFDSHRLHELWLARWLGDQPALELALNESSRSLAADVVVASVALWVGQRQKAEDYYQRFRERRYREDFPDLVLRPELVSEFGSKEEASRVYTGLQNDAERYMVFGGIYCVSDGSFQRHLGLLAERMGEHSLALEHLEQAEQRNSRIAHGPVLALTQLQRARLQASSPSEKATIGVPRGSASNELSAGAGLGIDFKLVGESWCVSYQGRELVVADADGMRYLAWLVERPHVSVHVLELMALRKSAESLSNQAALDGAPLGGTLAEGADAKAMAQYRQQLERLRELEESAITVGDSVRAQALREEQLALAEHLTSELNAKKRGTRSPAEKARVNVTQRIRSAIRRLAQLEPGLGHHLSSCIKTGQLCSYSPPP